MRWFSDDSLILLGDGSTSLVLCLCAYIVFIFLSFYLAWNILTLSFALCLLFISSYSSFIICEHLSISCFICLFCSYYCFLMIALPIWWILSFLILEMNSLALCFSLCYIYSMAFTLANPFPLVIEFRKSISIVYRFWVNIGGLLRGILEIGGAILGFKVLFRSGEWMCCFR